MHRILLLAGLVSVVQAAEPAVPVGAARIDITPELPIRLSGYQGGARAKATERVEQRLFARALAIGGNDQRPAVLITAEIIGVSQEISDAVAAALRESHGIPRERVAVCTTHTHTGPQIRGVLPYMFGEDLPAEDTARIARYTDELREKLVRVGREALQNRRPGTLAWGEGKAGFATQRRRVADGKYAGFGVVPDGMVDHALPVLRVADGRGGVRAVLTSYACHCTTLRGSENFVHPDWAGVAAAQIEAKHAGAVALVAVGCGADANPEPRTGLADAARHGEVIASEVARVLGGPLRAIGAVTHAAYRVAELPLDHVVTREELEQRAKQQAPLLRYTAAKFLAQLEAGRAMPASIPLPVQAWRFGDGLAMVFLGGEVVAEYSLRLKREVGNGRLWVNAYSNSVPSYVASSRVIREGGYEAEGSMNYYGWPTSLALEAEERLVATVHEVLRR